MAKKIYLKQCLACRKMYEGSHHSTCPYCRSDRWKFLPDEDEAMEGAV